MTSTVTDSPWMVVAEVAQYVQMSNRLIIEALNDGSLRGYQRKAGGRWRVHRDDIDAWLRGAR